MRQSGAYRAQLSKLNPLPVLMDWVLAADASVHFEVMQWKLMGLDATLDILNDNWVTCSYFVISVIAKYFLQILLACTSMHNILKYFVRSFVTALLLQLSGFNINVDFFHIGQHFHCHGLKKRPWRSVSCSWCRQKRFPDTSGALQCYASPWLQRRRCGHQGVLNCFCQQFYRDL